MIAKQPFTRTWPNLAMPLRDALRGVATLVDATEDVLEPAAQLLPEPLRSRFKHSLDALEAAGKRLISAPTDAQQIQKASKFLSGSEAGTDAMEACASILVYAWEHLNDTSIDHRLMISETIVADQLSSVRDKSSSPAPNLGAEVVIALRQSSAIGRVPGLTGGIASKDKQQVDLSLLAIAVWLLSSRSNTLEEEEKVLDLSQALVSALQVDVSDLFSDTGKLAGFLAETSAHL